jgi:hypothetical protein
MTAYFFTGKILSLNVKDDYFLGFQSAKFQDNLINIFPRLYVKFQHVATNIDGCFNSIWIFMFYLSSNFG